MTHQVGAIGLFCVLKIIVAIGRINTMATKRLTKEEGNRIVVERGWFQGLNYIIREYGLTANEGAMIKAGLFKLLMAKILEAKGEITHLQMAVSEMEAACRMGIVPRPAEGLNAFSDSVGRLIHAARRFDGWTISLLESDMSILAATDTPATAGKRIEELKRSFAELWATRVQDGFKMMASHPELFDVKTIRV